MWQATDRRSLGNPKVFAVVRVKVQFSGFTLDSDTRLLRRGPVEIRLSPKAFDLLSALVAQRPNVLAKSDLQGQIWPDTFVVDANLNVLVAEIRRVLQDTPRNPQFIRTVHGIGYAFCGEAVDLDRRRPQPANVSSARCWLLWNERAMVLTEGENIVGRDPHCSVWLDASGVSRRHARVRITRGSDIAILEDLGSKNGTLVQNLPIREPAHLKDGAVIQIGSVELKLRIWSAGKAPETERIRARRK